MNNDKKVIMDYTGEMSPNVIREKLDMLYDKRRNMDWFLQYDNEEVDAQDLNSQIGDVSAEIMRLCNMASDRRYGKKTIQQIREKWDGSERNERKDMLKFLPHLDEMLDGFADRPMVLRVYHAPEKAWNDLDSEIKAEFNRHSLDGKKAINTEA